MARPTRDDGSLSSAKCCFTKEDAEKLRILFFSSDFGVVHLPSHRDPLLRQISRLGKTL